MFPNHQNITLLLSCELYLKGQVSNSSENLPKNQLQMFKWTDRERHRLHKKESNLEKIY